MSQDRDRRGRTRIQIVRNGETPLELTGGELELVVRHKWDHGFLLIIALSMICIGLLLGLVASHVADIQRLEHGQDLALTWVQTHRHAATGAQPVVPEEVKPLLSPTINLEQEEPR